MPDEQDKLYSLEWGPEFKALKLDSNSKSLIGKFVGSNEDGTPARQEITKHLKFLVRELEQIHKGKIEECFMICQRLFHQCADQKFSDCLEYFFRKIIANFLIYTKDQTIQGLPVIDAVLKALRIDSIEEHITNVILNFEADGQGIALKILPLLLKIPVDVFVSGEGMKPEQNFLKHIKNFAKYPDFEL